MSNRRSSSAVSRRTLLLGGSALAFMAACGKSGDQDDVAVDDTDDAAGGASGGDKNTLTFVPAANMHVTGIDERVTFALFQGVPASLVSAEADVTVAFQKPGSKELTEFVSAERKSDGIAERAFYVVDHRFDVPGNWGVQARVPGKKPANHVFKVDDPATVAWPTPGTPLPRVKTPTPTETLGVNPICTRSEGVCPLHGTSLDVLLGNGKPTIVLLATPALCKSVTCGPVLDIVLAERDAIGDRANVVHVEVFNDTAGKTLSPAFAAFKVTSEPVLFFADASGVVTERFNGPFDASEARAAISRLLG